MKIVLKDMKGQGLRPFLPQESLPLFVNVPAPSAFTPLVTLELHVSRLISRSSPCRDEACP